MPPMCGIVGYAGARPALGIVVSGLRRLEYRGYDSAGVAVLGDDALVTVKRAGDKVGRNDPCPCGSGKKYKKCHGAAAAAS